MKQQKKQASTKQVNLAHHIEFNDIFTRRRFTNLTKALDLSAAQLEDIHALYQEIDANELDSEQVTLLLGNVDKQFAQIKAELPIAIQKQLDKAKNLRGSLAHASQIKVVLSIITYGRSYEKTRMNLEVSFSQMWIDLKNGLLFLTVDVSSRGAEVGDTFIRDVEIDKKATIKIYKTAKGTYTFTCGAAICVDGAPNAYAPNNKGTDANRAAGHNENDVETYEKDDNENYLLDKNGEKVPKTLFKDTNWWGVVTDKKGKPIVRKDADNKEWYISTSSYNYEGFDKIGNVQERFVNANKVPYAVLSQVFEKDLKTRYGPEAIKRGDLIHVKNNRNCSEIWTGYLESRVKDDSLGEVSKAAAEKLGIDSNPRTGGEEAYIITYTIYPNTAPTGLFKNDAEAIDYIRRNGKNLEQGKAADKNPRIPKTEPC